MALRVVDNEIKRGLLMKQIANKAVPFTVEIVDGKRRSTKQNRLMRKWITEIVEQRGDVKAEEVRAEMKLRFGVPILRHENEMFCEKYDRIVKPLAYEQKLELMAEPFDFPVSRLMTTEQATRMLDDIFKFYTEQGFRLTMPEPKEPVNANERAA